VKTLQEVHRYPQAAVAFASHAVQIEFLNNLATRLRPGIWGLGLGISGLWRLQPDWPVF